jgi:hypothetical protein
MVGRKDTRRANEVKTPTQTTTRKRLAGLAERVRGLDAVFACGGTVVLGAPVELQFRDGKVIRVVAVEGWRRSDLGKRLMKRCGPAPFGVGRETRHDRRVRDGGQLLAAHGAFRASGLDPEASGILAEIHRLLCPGDERPPKAAPYALNVYDRHGHFVTHKDTPRDPAVFGTLVACLPVPFRGGRLVLRHDSTQAYEWETAAHYGLAGARDDYSVRWAAFYGDVNHEVEPITDGTRVTLTWLLRRSAGGDIAIPAPRSSEVDLEASLLEAYADPRFLPAGGTLGIPCVHLYAEVPGLARPRDALSRETASRLKGRDRLAGLAALRAGVRARYRPYLFETGANESWRLARAPTGPAAAIFREYRLGARDLEDAMPIEHHADWDERDDVTWILPPPGRDKPKDDRSQDAEAASQLLGELEYSATDYFGNEGSDAAFYLSAALLLDVPSARERGVQRAKPLKRWSPGTRRRAPARG